MPNGEKIPRGAWLAVPSVRVHYDERFYPKAQLYEPFRFVPTAVKEPAEFEVTTDSKNLGEHDSTASKQRRYQGLSTASETYLAFGYGRHSWYVPVIKYVEAFPATNIYKPWPLVCSPPAEVARGICCFPL